MAGKKKSKSQEKENFLQNLARRASTLRRQNNNLRIDTRSVNMGRTTEAETAAIDRNTRNLGERGHQQMLREVGRELLEEELRNIRIQNEKTIKQLQKNLQKQQKRDEKTIQDLNRGVHNIIGILNSSKKTLARSKSLTASEASDIFRNYLNSSSNKTLSKSKSSKK
jgi:hypothetical protein